MSVPLRNDDALRERLQSALRETYSVTRELGGGGSSRVFLATELALDRPVVLKVLHSELTEGVEAERFRREILIAARLQHPHLVPLLSAGTIPGSGAERDVRWFSMPFVEGRTLREWLVQRGTPPLSESIRLIRELASALAYAHAHNVIHRDVKPENVLLSDGVCMVSDFGVAKALDDASEKALKSGKRVTTVSVALGTPAYMSPEQVQNAKVVDHRADIYALGCVAYELFTGAPPLARSSLRATLAAQVNEQPAPLRDKRADVPTALADMIMRCLAKDPHQRPHSASQLLKAIDSLAAITGEYQAVMPVSTAPPARPSVFSRLGVMVAIALALAALVTWGWLD